MEYLLLMYLEITIAAMLLSAGLTKVTKTSYSA